MSKRNGDRSRANRRSYRRLKHREAIALFQKTEVGQALLNGIAAMRSVATATATAADVENARIK
jgi:hypothetical protein